MEITIKNYRRSRKFGWAYTFAPTGEGLSIETPTMPDYVGTLNQLHEIRNNDTTWMVHCRSAFYNTADFYAGERITHTWTYHLLEAAPDLPFDPERDDYREWRKKNFDNRWENDCYGWGWLAGWHAAEGTEVRIRVEAAA